MNTSPQWSDTFRQVIELHADSFALLFRRESDSSIVELLTFEETHHSSLGEASLDADEPYLVVLPYRLLGDKGFAFQEDHASLRVCRVKQRLKIPLDVLIDLLPEPKHMMIGATFDLSDEDYSSIAKAVIAEEIGTGHGSNFVIRRTLLGQVQDFSVHDALGYFKRLLLSESGAYWTFLFSGAAQILVGATPERHVSCRSGRLAMTPISGTLRIRDSGVSQDELLRFVNDNKETEELYMVLDEELKMVSRLCPGGGVVSGPGLRKMSKVIHTEYEIAGFTTAPPLAVLRETMFAPTVIGSPLENAARVVARREKTPRGYYSGVIALVEPMSVVGTRDMDSAILIRTAAISHSGAVSISVGSTIVRESDPIEEAAETAAKASSLLGIMSIEIDRHLCDHRIESALTARRSRVSAFWQTRVEDRIRKHPDLAGLTCLVVNAEDDFTDMIAVILRSIGMQVTVAPVRTAEHLERFDFIVFGPGPGDPSAQSDERVSRIRDLMIESLNCKQKFLAVCLSHQVLGTLLGLPITRLPRPHQGKQAEVSINGQNELVGFYNTFVATSSAKIIPSKWGDTEVYCHPGTDHVYAFKGLTFSSVQFHLESVLTRNSRDLLISLSENMLVNPAQTEVGMVS